jgi:hypothetical protein
MKERIDLPKEVEFLFVTIGQAAVGAFQRGLSQDEFETFCKGMWETMEINGVENFSKLLAVKICADLDASLGLGMSDYIQGKAKKKT